MPLSKAPKRLQGLLLCTQRYNYTLEIRPAKEIPLADALSRAPLTNPQEKEEALTVNNVMFCAINNDRLKYKMQRTKMRICR